MEFLSYNIIWKTRILITESSEKISELQVRIELTTDPSSSSLDALTTELLEALRYVKLQVGNTIMLTLLRLQM